MEEQWKSIFGYPAYEVSNKGRVRRVTRGRGATAGRILRPGYTRFGYGQVALGRKPGRGPTNTKRLCVLVCAAFHGPKPFSTAEVCHQDGNPSNDIAENLRWDNHKANNADKWKHGTQPYGERHHNAILTQQQVDEICLAHHRAIKGRIRARFGWRTEIATKYGISPEYVGVLIQGRRWIQSAQDSHTIL